MFKSFGLNSFLSLTNVILILLFALANLIIMWCFERLQKSTFSMLNTSAFPVETLNQTSNTSADLPFNYFISYTLTPSSSSNEAKVLHEYRCFSFGVHTSDLALPFLSQIKYMEPLQQTFY